MHLHEEKYITLCPHTIVIHTCTDLCSPMEKYQKPSDVALVVIALVLPTDTRREQQLFASSTRGGFRTSYVPNYLDNSRFIFSAHHKTLLGKIQRGTFRVNRRVNMWITLEIKSGFDRLSLPPHLSHTAENASLEGLKQNYWGWQRGSMLICQFQELFISLDPLGKTIQNPLNQ